MTAHVYGTGSFDQYPTSVVIPSKAPSLREVRDRLAGQLAEHRCTSTMIGDRYSNPVRDGYDRGLTHAITLIDSLLNGDTP